MKIVSLNTKAKASYTLDYLIFSSYFAIHQNQITMIHNNIYVKVALFISVAILSACKQTATEVKVTSLMRIDLSPPLAMQKTDTLSIHGDIRLDDYFWLRERENPEVISYLEAENAYVDSVMAPLAGFQDSLFQEMKSRIKEDDSSLPYQLDDYFYYSRYEVGGEYPIYCRRKGSMEAEEEIIANGNELGKDKSFFSFFPDVSPNHQLMAIISDTVGRRLYDVTFKDLSSGTMLTDVIKSTTGNIVWANDNKTIFYSKQDPQTLRSNQIFKHILGTPQEKDELIFEETDETFYVYVNKTKSKKYILISSGSTLSDEVRVLDADQPDGNFQVVQPRESDLLYNVDHYGNKFYIRTNLNAKNFKLVEASVANPSKEQWQDVIPHREDVLFENFEIFEKFLVVDERKNGLTAIKIINWDNRSEHALDFGESAYTAYMAYNPEFNTDKLRYGYNSLTTPNSTYEYDMVKREKELLKQQPVLGTFKSEDYMSERVMVKAADGVEVPVSLVYHKNTKLDGTAPTLIYGYGSYGYSMEPYFSTSRLSLLDRGFVYAIAHIRGGQEMGRQWYDDGKLLKKKNTFTDFIACSEYLIEKKYTAKDKLFAMGGSAGGLLMGAISNMRPDLYKGIVSSVPFVDVISTMLDETIPLTTGEYDEWGNPNDKEYYDYILSYSPYDNLGAMEYPNMLVTTGLHDSQVQYWEPAKYVAKIRQLKKDKNLVLLKTNMDAGHGGASGRFEALKETSLQYAFLIDLAGKTKI